MFRILNLRLRRFCSRLRWSIRRRPRSKIIIRKFGKTNSFTRSDSTNGSAVVHPNGQLDNLKTEVKPIKIATFNAALFSMAPAVPKTLDFENEDHQMGTRSTDVMLRTKSANDRPKSILKQSPLHPNSMNSDDNLSRQKKFPKSRLRVSINLPDNEISLLRNRKLEFMEDKETIKGSNLTTILRGKAHMRSQSAIFANIVDGDNYWSTRTVVEVLKELDADVLALQDVKAEEEKEMKPLSDLAAALGMNYVFAESWAPEYGNAILSKWPIKRWKVQKIFDDTDFRNVLMATIDVPEKGEANFYCTHLDHLDENWRMKQINAIIQSNDGPHILAGGLNSLDETDYSAERWMDIVKYYEEMGKPTPKVEVMRFLKSKHYTDAKEFAGECEPVVMIAKGQNVQGTCKYGTRVDYILASSNSPYKFVPGSYSVLSSKGTSDHHIVKVDMIMVNSSSDEENVSRKRHQPKQRVVKITSSSPSKAVWKAPT
ncbi:uncharacterized protein LOC110614623 [Manihot esculenta]|uniref:Endonuclease/exonuclease/phosphatase domain-containing protein n=1 Tax=Manihot esculenta TaxID=3983 RepID=A0A251KUB3_MANES|nr:uncharacterized protein LOC110614623 [Manihot esculenta]OAY49641.1 hypothetical protein MANES_05G071500v8 [Manihot esculenta]OAY49642.1 hypothetical protein MANES_05G071500v8 [Manihot esculenta]